MNPTTRQRGVTAERPVPGWPGLIAAYSERLGMTPDGRVVTLFEGGTALLPAPTLSARLGVQVLLKVEGANPTGSFADRGMTVAVTRAVAAGATGVVCASTGNTAASAAAYAARAGLTCVVLVPDRAISGSKLAQAMAHGARIVRVRGDLRDCLRLARAFTAARPWLVMMDADNPARMQGEKTVAFEVCDVLGRAPDVHIVPVGGGGNLTATWLGYREYYRAGVIDTLPRMYGFQASGSEPMLTGSDPTEPPTDPSAGPAGPGTVTLAAAIRVGKPAARFGALRARDQSRGLIDAVTDEQILTAYHLVAACEGVFVEPAAAAGIAGLLATVADGRLPAGSVVVCTVTGNGLKDTGAAIATMADPVVIPVDSAAVITALELDTTPGEELLDDTTDPATSGPTGDVGPWTPPTPHGQDAPVTNP